MKKLIFILVAGMILMSSCGNRQSSTYNTSKTEPFAYNVIVIDSCEYIQYRTSYSYLEVTHKGNCKFCAERAKKNK